MAQVRFLIFTIVSASAFAVVLAQLHMAHISSSGNISSNPLDKFCGKYYFNDDRRYNFVAAEKFQSQEEKIKMINLFKPSVPKAREDMPALKIMMLRPRARSE